MIHLSVEGGRLRLRFPWLSDEQQAALVSDREVAVSAGAGAGKTTTLSARYAALFHRLIQREDTLPDVQAVLVLTFSERAAQEMRERCYSVVAAVARALCTEADRLADEGLTPARLRRTRMAWEGLRDRFAGAAISTFHGFCARIVREFPVEASTAPDFHIVEEDEATTLIDAAAAAEVDTLLSPTGDPASPVDGAGPADPGSAADPDGLLLLRTFNGRSRLIEQVSALVRARGEVEPVVRAHAAGAFTLDQLLVGAPLSAREAATFLDEEWRPFAQRLLEATTGVATPWLISVADTLANLFPLPDDPLLVYGRYATALATVQASNGGPRNLTHHTTVGPRKLWGTRWPAAKPALESLQVELDQWAHRMEVADEVPNPHDRTLLRTLGALGRLVAGATLRYRAALDTRGALDFAELQLRARSALDHPLGAVLTTLHDRHRYLMVDEFQDTDALQWSIVSRLARPGGLTGDRLFFVGDAKQAIYGFRGGDVQVFNLAREQLAGADVGGLAGTLSTNRRSRPALITFFNGLFADVLGPATPGRPAWEAAYEPLGAGRGDTGGTVRWMTYASVDADDRIALEAGAVSGLIAGALWDPGSPYAALRLADPTTHPSPPIALLLRRRTHLLQWEDALRGAGVPYLVLGGVGFWSRPEVVDIVNLLLALVRGDLVARVGVLRSPLFGLDDQQLLDLVASDHLRTFGRAPLPAPLQNDPGLGEADRRWRVLERLRHHVPVAELISHALQSARQEFQQAFLHPDGRAQANLEQLLALADAHDQRGGDLESFTTRIATRVEDEARATEAALPATDARVVLLTIHASKGLEFPLVILPELDGNTQGPPATGVQRVRTPEGWALSCTVADLDGAHDAMAAPGFHRRMLAHARRLEEAEYLRLFYVACTRARDHLVLVGGHPDKPRSQPRWSDHLDRWVASLPATPPWLHIVDIGTDTRGTDTRGTDGPGTDGPGTDGRTTKVIPAEGSPTGREIHARPGPPASLPPAPPDLAKRLAPVPPRRRFEISPSSLPLATNDRPTWRLRHLLGVPEIALAEEDGASLAASALGELIHGLLEDGYLDGDAAPGAPSAHELARVRWLGLAREAGLTPAQTEAGWAEALTQLDQLERSAVVAALFHRANHRELPVLLEHPPLVLNGRLDLLCRDPDDGAWMVVDYKSQRFHEPDEALTRRYRWQLLAYSAAASRVLGALGQETVTRAALLLTHDARLVRLPDWTEADYTALDALMDDLARDALATTQAPPSAT